jgi:hypothetical protein
MVHWQITGDYLWHMEDVLYQYALPYDPLRPLICFDERPCFLMGDVGAVLPMSPGKAKRYHYDRRFAHFSPNLLKSLDFCFAKSIIRKLQSIDFKGLIKMIEPWVMNMKNMDRVVSFLPLNRIRVFVMWRSEPDEPPLIMLSSCRI